ncbi:MAG: SAP domain-containing protein [Clostridia bacterium]|nr:SAP domain-containing protein [Clostridia bacterium]
MGILKSLFGVKKDKPTVTVQFETNPVHKEETPIKKVSASVQDLVLLSLAEDYKVGETKYPEYFRSRFGIGFPNERFQKLEKIGLLRQSTSIEALPHLKATELKAIASKFGIKTSGKKEELCSRIAENVSEEAINGDISERYWIVTEKGKALLEENKYISFFMEKHSYSLENVGLDIESYSKLFSGNPNGRVRDVIWGELNRRSIDYYSKGMATGEFGDYCELLRTMALFLEEESRHKDALGMYMRYIHYRANFYAGLSAIRYYSVLKKVDDAADTLYMSTEIYPFIAEEIQTMSYGCGYDSQQLYYFMKDAFSKEKDTGVFSSTELADLVMCGLNGDQEGQKKICRTAMRSAVKKLPKK